MLILPPDLEECRALFPTKDLALITHLSLTYMNNRYLRSCRLVKSFEPPLFRFVSATTVILSTLFMLPISTISTETETGERPSRIRVVARG